VKAKLKTLAMLAILAGGNLIDVAAFVVALAFLSVGCRDVYPPLGLIVPSAIVLIVLLAVRFKRAPE
jgi:hypothetical protein